MAIEFRSASSNGASAASVTVTKPAGTVDGDILIAIVSVADVESSGNSATCAGWTEVCKRTVGQRVYVVLCKRASSEGTDYTFASTGADYMSAAVGCYLNCIADGSPIDVYSDTEYTTFDTTLRAASSTTTVDGALLVFSGCFAASLTATPPVDFAERVDYAAASGLCVYLADYVQISAGSSGSKDATLSDDSSAKHAFLVALKPLIYTTGAGAAQCAAVALGGAGNVSISGTGALQIGAASLSGTGHYDITGMGTLTIGSPALSGSMWMDSAHLRHLGGKAMLWGAKGRAEIRGLKGKASM